MIDVARRILVSGVSQFPNTRNVAWFHCNLGHLAAKQGDINSARACYNRALDTTPSHASLSVILEYAHMEDIAGTAKEARKLFELAVSRFAKKDEVWSAFVEFERKKTPLQPSAMSPQTSVMGSTSAASGWDEKNLRSLKALPSDSNDVSALLSRRLKLQQALAGDDQL